MRRTSRSVRVDVAPGTAGKDAWEQATLSRTVTADTMADSPSRPKEGRRDCTCMCYCGATSTESKILCAMCSRGVHHVCSRACRSYADAAYDYHGIKGVLPFIPERRPCNGGKGKETLFRPPPF